MHTNSIIIFDTTLRDGGQTPGCAFTHEGRLKVAHTLDTLGVDVIEAGFAASSADIFRSVAHIATNTKNARVAVLARAVEDDIDKAADAIKTARSGRIHTFIATSPVHMRDKLKKSPAQVLDLIARSVQHARNKCGDVEWSAEDASRSELPFLTQAVETAIKAGATTINLPDTVGYALPHQYKAMFEHVRMHAKGSHKVLFSAHCHNDLGLAVANSLAALEGGARQVECTLNGIGERAGNAALEEVVMALQVHSQTLPYAAPHLTTHHFNKASRLVVRETGLRLAPTKAIVGRNAFAHESGIHQDGTVKNPNTYEIMTPESVGAKRRLPVGEQSGLAGIMAAAKTMGYTLNTNTAKAVAEAFKDACGINPKTNRTQLLKRCIRQFVLP